MLPSRKFLGVLKFMRLCSAACGADVLNKNYQINSITYLVIFCIVFYFVFSIYTVQLKFSENWTIILESFCMVGSVLQGISKLVGAIFYRTIFRAQFVFLESVYMEYEAINEDYTKILDKCITRLKSIIQVLAWLYFAFAGILMAVPLIMWALLGRRLFVMQFYIPLFDPDTVHGYLMTIGMQSTCLMFGTFGNYAADVFMLMNFSHGALIVDLFEMKAKELNETAEHYGSPKVNDKLKEVIRWHQIYTSYVEKADIIYFWTNFTQVTTAGLSMVLTLVILFTGDWPGSYAYLTLSFIMLYLYCGMGTFVEIASERMMDEIYAIHWYNMTVPQQKAIRLMLMQSQSPKQITVGGVVPLSVSTGLQVTKTVYSVFMMMLNFFD